MGRGPLVVLSPTPGRLAGLGSQPRGAALRPRGTGPAPVHGLGLQPRMGYDGQLVSDPGTRRTFIWATPHSEARGAGSVLAFPPFPPGTFPYAPASVSEHPRTGVCRRFICLGWPGRTRRLGWPDAGPTAAARIPRQHLESAEAGPAFAGSRLHRTPLRPGARRDSGVDQQTYGTPRHPALNAVPLGHSCRPVTVSVRQVELHRSSTVRLQAMPPAPVRRTHVGHWANGGDDITSALLDFVRLARVSRSIGSSCPTHFCRGPSPFGRTVFPAGTRRLFAPTLDRRIGDGLRRSTAPLRCRRPGGAPAGDARPLAPQTTEQGCRRRRAVCDFVSSLVVAHSPAGASASVVV